MGWDGALVLLSPKASLGVFLLWKEKLKVAYCQRTLGDV